MNERVALVTGASGALGAEIARLLDGKGYSVALHYAHHPEPVDELRSELSHPSLAVQADVGDWDSVRAMHRTVAEKLGAVSVLVNSGAVRRDGLMATQSVQEWTETIQVNLVGSFHTARAVLPQMLRSRWGRVVNVVSPAGMLGSRGQTAYSASKAGVIGMTRSLALECGRRNVTVNALSPGFMPTSLTSGVPDEVAEEFRRRTATRGFASPADVAMGVSLLVDSDYITGQVLSIDGGLVVS
ncbi:SDR family NAD(P)-dependent oxidoreductase [Nocardiopsis alborubida]|uniref:SDR family NAD(P)-dependent oxidoreductase n=1 Tax=Nocardiopsis alborubida TaxID=146802 RepID=UPI000AF10010|nr:SDR family NAD(P)-dependent oxidoreductase [Nocardiopsis alborubida]